MEGTAQAAFHHMLFCKAGQVTLTAVLLFLNCHVHNSSLS